MRIVAFGDSITYGAWDTEGGWVERIKRAAHATTVASGGEHKVQVINLGIGGNTSSQLLARMESEIQARVSTSWPFLFTIAIGTNDGREKNGEPEVTLAQFEKNIHEIISIAKRYTDKILVLGLVPIGIDVLPFKGVTYLDKSVATYDASVGKIANAEGLTYVPIRPLFGEAERKDLFSYDLLHPNDEGHRRIADAVSSQLEAMGVKF